MRREICGSLLKLGLLIRNANSVSNMVARNGNSNRVGGIIGCVGVKTIRRNGFICRKIHYAKDWFNGLKNGHLRVVCLIWCGVENRFRGRLAGPLAPPSAVAPTQMRHFISNCATVSRMAQFSLTRFGQNRRIFLCFIGYPTFSPGGTGIA